VWPSSCNGKGREREKTSGIPKPKDKLSCGISNGKRPLAFGLYICVAWHCRGRQPGWPQPRMAARWVMPDLHSCAKGSSRYYLEDLPRLSRFSVFVHLQARELLGNCRSDLIWAAPLAEGGYHTRLGWLRFLSAHHRKQV
jgi:hypothetical protein